MGNSLNMNPMFIILAITIGGFYFGVIGMFISVPIAAILKIILNHLLESQERKQQEQSKT
jgi:predicted PurR-regulated permease PerM